MRNPEGELISSVCVLEANNTLTKSAIKKQIMGLSVGQFHRLTHHLAWPSFETAYSRSYLTWQDFCLILAIPEENQAYCFSLAMDGYPMEDIIYVGQSRNYSVCMNRQRSIRSSPPKPHNYATYSKATPEKIQELIRKFPIIDQKKREIQLNELYAALESVYFTDPENRKRWAFWLLDVFYADCKKAYSLLQQD